MVKPESSIPSQIQHRNSSWRGWGRVKVDSGVEFDNERKRKMRNIIEDTLKKTVDSHIQTITATNALNGNDGRSNAYKAMFQAGIKYPGLNYSELKAKVQSDPELIAIANGNAPKETGKWMAMVQRASGNRNMRGRGPCKRLGIK